MSPSLTHWSKLNNENLESEMLKCMIDIRNKKNKLLPFFNSDPKTANETEETNNNHNNSTNQNNNWSYLSIVIICFISMIFISLFGCFMLRKNKQNIEMNIQANAHSIDKNLGILNEENKKEFKQKINEPEEKTKKNEKKDFFKSNIIIDKENVLGFGANGTIVYSGLFQNREMAIKRIIAHNAELAKQEMEILMKLDHPNIIKFYYYEEQKYFF